MKKVLFITNIPAPYRIDFYNELGKYVDLTVLFEAKGASDQGIKFNWNLDKIEHFETIFLSNGDIQERKIDWSILKYLSKRKYDEIVVTNYSYFTEMIAILYLKAMRIPYYMETDGGIIRNENRLKRCYKRFLVSGAKGYFSPSKSSDNYLEFYGAKKGLIYRYPFTSICSKDICRRVLTLDEKTDYKRNLGVETNKMILGIGQFIHRKGWDVLLRAASMMKTECDIFIVGGEIKKEYQEIVKKLNLKHIHFCGFKTKDVLKSYFNAADIFVLPTREDIWGLVINEALSNALPVITTNMCVAGIELIEKEKNGDIVEVNNPEALAKSCDIILNSDLEKYSVNARNTILDYSIENMATAHIKAWEEY